MHGSASGILDPWNLYYKPEGPRLLHMSEARALLYTKGLEDS